MSTPSVSVLLAVRDGMPFLPEALASVRAQTFEDFEVVVQDDGSTDGSLAAAAAVAEEDARVLVASGPAVGVAVASNAAAARARGALFVRMDADDRCAATRLERLVAFARAHPAVGWFGSRVRYFPRDAVGAGLRHYETWINGLLTHEDIMRNRFVEYPIPHPSSAMRREVFERLGGYRQGPFPEDYDLFLRAADDGVVFGKHPEVLLDWREGPHRATRIDPRYDLERFLDVKMRHLLPLLERKGRPVAIVGAGPDGKRLAKRLLAAGVRVSHFLEVHPRRIGQSIHGAAVVGYDDVAAVAHCFFLAAVGQKGRRDEVRRLLEHAGLREEDDYLCVQ